MDTDVIAVHVSLIYFNDMNRTLELAFCPSLVFVHSSLRQNYRHRQSAEAGAGKGLIAAKGSMHGVLRLVTRGETLLEPTQTAALSLHTTMLKRRTMKNEEGRRRIK